LEHGLVARQGFALGEQTAITSQALIHIFLWPLVFAVAKLTCRWVSRQQSKDGKQ